MSVRDEQAVIEVTVVAGGTPSPAETAAIIEAVRSTHAQADPRPAPVASAWAAAGRYEATGRPTIASRAALPRR